MAAVGARDADPGALAAPRPALVFIGFMGSGKTAAARAARAAGLETTEADELLEGELGMPIARFFGHRGEEEFRSLEAAQVGQLLEEAEGGVIALGGGAVLSERVRAALERHVVVWLQVSAEEAWRRVEGSDRPLAQDRDRFETLHAEREPLYAALADAVLPSADEGLVARTLPALLGLLELPRGTRMAWARSESGEYPAYVGEGLLGSGYWPLEGRRFCVTDTTVSALYAGAVEPLAGLVDVEPGERAKTLAEAERVLRELASLGMARADHLVALGGGVVGDLAGFCAATYQRGVEVVQVPTTVVAQVDSAYGGKTGVDLPEAKNYVGVYHLPSAVIADTATLATLPAVEIAAGFAEVVKTALIAGGWLWERVRALERLDPAELDDVIFACVRTKLEIVAADERDSGRRAVLNLGHTVGHAVEAAGGYRHYRHGEAVGLGLLAALRISGADELREEVRSLLDRHGLPTRLDRGVDVDAVLAAAELDKKRTAEGPAFVLLERPGEPAMGQRVDPVRVRDAVEELVGSDPGRAR
jgi:shikimate kinase/3-dehydroquinate synthase